MKKEKEYMVNFEVYEPSKPKPKRKKVDLCSNDRSEALNYISDISSAGHFGKPDFIKIGRSLYVWNVTKDVSFTINFKFNEE